MPCLDKKIGMKIKWHKIPYEINIKKRDRKFDEFFFIVNEDSRKIANLICRKNQISLSFSPDLLQEFMILFFTKVLPKAKEIKCDLSTYFYRVCQNYANDLYRNGKSGRQYRLNPREILQSDCKKWENL
jgi:hypothetical protein